MGSMNLRHFLSSITLAGIAAPFASLFSKPKPPFVARDGYRNLKVVRVDCHWRGNMPMGEIAGSCYNETSQTFTIINGERSEWKCEAL